MPTIRRPGAPALALAALVLAIASAAPRPAAAGPPRPSGVFALRDVRPGQEVTAWTVFAGREIEPFHGKVLGIVKGFMGPGRDVVLVDFPEERLRHTGIVHGMSGSPVYIGDRILGALSLVLSPFPRDTVGGVTPIEAMLADADGRDPAGPPAGPGAGAILAPPPDPGSPAALAAAALPARPVPGLRPILAPLVMSGVPPEVFAAVAPSFRALGLEPVQAMGGADPGLDLGPEALEPGSAVSAVLADGDLSLDASGTVTWRDGNRILAFGHPFLQQGRLGIPMAPAEVVTTLADQTFSYKVTNAARPVGTVTFDRTSTIVGEIGLEAAMVPVRVRILRQGALIGQYRYRYAPNPWIAPAVMQLLVASSLSTRWGYDQEQTYRLRATIALKGHEPLMLQDTWAVAPDPRSASPNGIALDIALHFLQLYANPFAAAEIESVELSFDTEARGLIDRLEGVYVDPEQVRAGRNLPVRVAVKGLRGERRILPIEVPVPAWAAGQRLSLRVADSNVLRAEALQAGAPLDRSANLDQLIETLSGRPRADRLYVQLLAPSPDAQVLTKRLTTLPGSVRDVLEQSGGPYRRLPRALLWQGSLAAEGMALGTQEVLVEVQP